MIHSCQDVNNYEWAFCYVYENIASEFKFFPSRSSCLKDDNMRLLLCAWEKQKDLERVKVGG